jgi:uncharacterized protein (DUF2249 family)
MTRELDVRDHSDETQQELLFDALDDTEMGAEIALTADRQVNTLLVQYQNDRGRSLAWEHDEPDGDPRRLQVTKGEPLDGEMGSFDVRDLIPQRRHEALLETFETLDTGEGFVLVNDHDPKPLYHELRSMHGDTFDWEIVEQSPGYCRVHVTNRADGGADSEAVSGESAVGGCEHGAHGAAIDEIEQTEAADSEAEQMAANESETNADDSIAVTEELDFGTCRPRSVTS